MYKLLLCWRYLRTRYIALASIVSVTLGVATMIVVNSVMQGFAHEMQDRIHNILSDVVVESRSMEGFYDPQGHMDEIRRLGGDKIEGLTATVVVPAMLSFQANGGLVTRPVQLIGIDEETYSQVGDFGKFLQHPANRERLSFALRAGGYDVRDHQAGPEAHPRPQMGEGGWPHRRRRVEFDRISARLAAAESTRREDLAQRTPAVDTSVASHRELDPNPREDASGATQQPSDAEKPAGDPPSDDIFAKHQKPAEPFDALREQQTGVVLGIALASFRNHEGEDRFVLLPGDDVKLMFPGAGMSYDLDGGVMTPKVSYDWFTVVDFYESKMSEYDSSFVFVPLRKLQELRGMINPSSGTIDPATGQADPATQVGYATAIQVKLKPGSNLNQFRDQLRAAFPLNQYNISTWRDKQGPLLAAVSMETAILNVLLFMIIAVAGFGILAIFLMIVVEKTRDIGILKSLGASASGVMGIFLAYGLSLGIVGAGAGLGIGLLFVAYINEIADVLALITGHEVFDPSIYYFMKIPTIVEPLTVGWIVAGALAIAVLASVLPALRAALLHPVEALRYE